MTLVRRQLQARRAAAALAMVALTVGLGAISTRTSAHTGAYYHPGLYGDGVYRPQHRATQYYFDDNYRGRGKAKEAAIRGAKHWNALGQTLTFTPHRQPHIASQGRFQDYCGGNPATPPLLRNGFPISLLFWENLPAGVLGVASWCYDYLPEGIYHPTAFKIALDSKRPWYTGAGKGVPAGKRDLESVATHEFGHATGWLRHYDGGAGDSLPGGYKCGIKDPERWTMCHEASKQTWERSLEKHDKHTFGNAY